MSEKAVTFFMEEEGGNDAWPGLLAMKLFGERRTALGEGPCPTLQAALAVWAERAYGCGPNDTSIVVFHDNRSEETPEGSLLTPLCVHLRKDSDNSESFRTLAERAEEVLRGGGWPIFMIAAR